MINGCSTLTSYIERHYNDAVMWKAKRLLDGIDSPILLNERIQQIAKTIALIPMEISRESYAKKIGKEYNVSWPVFKKVIDDNVIIRKKADDVKVRKNKVNKLDGDPKTWPFFIEEIAETKGKEVFKGIEIDLEKFIALLASFGYTRYELAGATGRDDNFAFVQLTDNVIKSVTRQQIIDHVENFIRKDYDFHAFKYVDSSILLNKFYKQMKTLFNKDLFARVRTDEPIVVNKDDYDRAYFYYQNGFVEVTKAGRTFHTYDKLNGSVWETQMQKRGFKYIDLAANETADNGIKYPHGVFADFCLMLCGGDKTRMAALTTVIGYTLHDYYKYKLKAILLTDGSISDSSEGRTGKTLLAKMMGLMRSYVEINGKDFDSGALTKYQDADLDTQIIHLNDVKHTGKFKFNFEDVFNDITEGYIVKKLYQSTFRQWSKMLISTNKTLNIMGASQRDRIVEFEVSDFFGENKSPADYYGQWFERDWDENEFALFDNFMCFCVENFLEHGLVPPATVNLHARKLLNHTAPEFLEFMSDCIEAIRKDGLPWTGYNQTQGNMFERVSEMVDFVFDKKQMYLRFIEVNSHFKNLTSNTFGKWLKQYAELKYGIKDPVDYRSGGIGYFQFQPAAKK